MPSFVDGEISSTLGESLTSSHPRSAAVLGVKTARLLPLAEVLARIKKGVKEAFDKEEEERRRTMSKTQEIELIR